MSPPSARLARLLATRWTISATSAVSRSRRFGRQPGVVTGSAPGAGGSGWSGAGAGGRPGGPGRARAGAAWHARPRRMARTTRPWPGPDCGTSSRSGCRHTARWRSAVAWSCPGPVDPAMPGQVLVERFLERRVIGPLVGDQVAAVHVDQLDDERVVGVMP